MLLTTYWSRNIMSENITYPVIRRRKEMDNLMLEMKTTFTNGRDLLCLNTSINEEEGLFFAAHKRVTWAVGAATRKFQLSFYFRR
jgi:hypothetical protein